MVMNALGGFAGGLAQSLQTGMQFHMQQQHLDRLSKSDARDAELHELRKDQYASEKEVRDRRNNAFKQIAEYTQGAAGGNQAAQPQAAPMQDPNAQAQQAGLAPDTRMAGTQPGGLAPLQTAQPPQEQIKPSKVLERGMVTGMYTPKALTDIAGIFAQNGLHEEGIKYMNQAYEFQKRGGVQAGMALMQNNPGSAAEAFKGAGMDLEGLPVKVNPDDPNDMNWKINIKGQGEKTINARDVIKSNMDPEEFFRIEDRRRKEENDLAMDKRKQDNVERKTTEEIGYLRSRSQLATARAENPGSLKPARSSDKSIEQAISRRDKRFDLKATVQDEEGKDRIDPSLRGAYDDTAAQLQSIIEDETGEELDHRQHHKLTDEILRFPVDGTPQQKATATAALLRRFKLDVPEAKQESKTASLGKPAQGRISQAAALKPKNEPTREEQELKSLESNRNYPTLRSDLKKLQKERYASNLNEKQKAEVEAKIKSILDSDKPKGGLK